MHFLSTSSIRIDVRVSFTRLLHMTRSGFGLGQTIRLAWFTITRIRGFLRVSFGAVALGRKSLWPIVRSIGWEMRSFRCGM